MNADEQQQRRYYIELELDRLRSWLAVAIAGFLAKRNMGIVERWTLTDEIISAYYELLDLGFPMHQIDQIIEYYEDQLRNVLRMDTPIVSDIQWEREQDFEVASDHFRRMTMRMIDDSIIIQPGVQHISMEHINTNNYDQAYLDVLHHSSQEAQPKSKSLSTYNKFFIPRQHLGSLESEEESKTGCISGNCPVCMEELSSADQSITMLECRHCFHTDCLAGWFKYNRHCPICRKEGLRKVYISDLDKPLSRRSSGTTSKKYKSTSRRRYSK